MGTGLLRGLGLRQASDWTLATREGSRQVEKRGNSMPGRGNGTLQPCSWNLSVDEHPCLLCDGPFPPSTSLDPRSWPWWWGLIIMLQLRKLVIGEGLVQGLNT